MLAMKVLQPCEPGKNEKKKKDLGYTPEMETALNDAADKLCRAFDEYQALSDAQQKIVPGLGASAVLLIDACVETGESMPAIGTRMGIKAIPIHTVKNTHVTETVAGVVNMHIAIKALPDVGQELQDAVKKAMAEKAMNN